MPSISRRRALAYVLCLVALLTVGGRLAFGHDAPAPPSARPAVVRAESGAGRRLTVHVVGAVRRPGLYRLRDGSRVDDAVRRAGGAKARAELALVNLAAPVADGQQVIVPGRGQAATTAAASASGAPVATVHLNSATLQELDTLPGVGPITAQKILDYRTENGAFGSVDELDAVSGIGPARLEEIRPLVDL